MYLSNTWEIPGIICEKKIVFILAITFYFHVMPLVFALEYHNLM